jgi:hypothetical protein
VDIGRLGHMNIGGGFFLFQFKSLPLSPGAGQS